MGQVGFQDYWVAGSRLYFQRDPIDSVVQAMADLGTIQTVNPAVTPEEATLVDPDGGVQTVVDQSLVSIEESYDVTMNNLSLENLSIMWLAGEPEPFLQPGTIDKEVTHTLIAERLFKIHDSDIAGTNLYGLSAIAGIFTGSPTVNVLTDIVSAARTLTLSAPISVLDGDALLVKGVGLANIANSQTYTADGDQAAVATIKVKEQPPADESAITGEALTGATVLKTGVEWDIVSIERGFAKLIPGGGVASGDFEVVFSLNALSGNRQFKPQTVKGTITGQAILIYSRRNNADQTVREMQVSVTPNSSNIQDADFSNIVLTFKVLNDLTSADPAGRVLQFAGTLPPIS